MDNTEYTLIIASIIAFVAIAGSIIAVGMEIDRRAIAKTRIGKDSDGNKGNDLSVHEDYNNVLDRVGKSVDLKIVEGLISEEKRTKLSIDLIRAGYFVPYAPIIFIVATIISILICSILGFIVVTMFFTDRPLFLQLATLSLFAYIGYFIPDMFLRSRRSQAVIEYTTIFPDFLDLLVVCVDAGLSLNAALDRVTSEFYSRSKVLASNFSAMLQEVRSGREFADALDNLSYRVDVDEIKSFCTLLKQSMELGSDVSQALRVYSEEMRVKRMFKAEEQANKLPVKMLLPLGLFIFPVILIVILAPIAVRVANMGK